MLPILVELPALGVTVYSYRTMILLGVAVCLLIGPRVAESLEGLDRRQVQRAMLWLLPVGMAGARLHYVAIHWDVYADRPVEALMFWRPGVHMGGGIALWALALPAVLWRFAIPTGKFADGLAPVLGLGMVFVRLGCFCAGCCYGTACDWPWCVRFPPGSLPYEFSPSIHPFSALHPLQLYFAAAGLAVSGIALSVRRIRRYEGQAALVALLSYSTIAAALEHLRADHLGRVYWGPWPQLEWTALATAAAAATILLTAAIARDPSAGRV